MSLSSVSASPSDRIALIGAGCASLSLAHYLKHYQPERTDITFYGEVSPALTASHFWGFWQMSWLDEPARISRKSWQKWQFASDKGIITHQSARHPYHALPSDSWLSHCGGHQTRPLPELTGLQTSHKGPVFDSRPPQLPARPMLQHFIGQHVRTPQPCFKPDTAILMDFRCSQEQGIHFIYLLPFSETEALVESTLFSHQLVKDSFYRNAISGYMAEIMGQPDMTVLSEERGIVPMCSTRPHDPAFLGIGANGGCLRPSSGYAFSFIQKQAQTLAHKLSQGQSFTDKSQVPKAHRHVDLWMDRVFLSVLTAHPQQAPDLFMKMAAALNGDGFARFMSGCAYISDYLRVIAAMPKTIFMTHALRHMKGSTDDIWPR